MELVGGSTGHGHRGETHAAWPLGAKRPRRTGGEVQQESSDRLRRFRGLKKWVPC